MDDQYVGLAPMDANHPLNRDIADPDLFSHYPDDKEKLAMAYSLIDRLTDTIFELDDGYYSSADEVLYADRWCCLVEGSIAPEFLDDDIRNLRLFTRHV